MFHLPQTAVDWIVDAYVAITGQQPSADFDRHLAILGQIAAALAALWILVKFVGPTVAKIIAHYRSAAVAKALARRTQTSLFYAELDSMYADILKLAIEHPHLRRPAPIASDDDALKQDYVPYPLAPTATPAESAANKIQTAQYDAYAFMVWNFIETIHDRCAEYKDDLIDTWGTIVAAENRIHRGWFLKQMRDEWLRSRDPAHEPSDKFCLAFRIFVFERNYRPETDATGRATYPHWSYVGHEQFRTQPQFA